ncbi:MAG: aminopeptidase P family protein [Nocardioides sp.]
MSGSESNPAAEPGSTGTETHDPAVTDAWSQFMRTGWGEAGLDLPRTDLADQTSARRAQLAATFPGERLVLPAGGYKVRANDTDYRFRAETSHTYFSGNQTSDAVLVIDDGDATLFVRPRSDRDTDEFFRDRVYGELWAGRRPSTDELSESLALTVRHIDELASVLSTSGKTRVLRGKSAAVDALVAADEGRDVEFAAVAAEMRLVKSSWEIDQLQRAVDATVAGFNDVVEEWDRAVEHGERWIEGTFFRRARVAGNDIGYDSIVAGGQHATTLHWIDNTGPITPGALALLDMGVEGHHLYTADVTRTIPVSGTFTPLQRELYSLVLAAQDAAVAALRPGVNFRAGHDAAMDVLAHGLDDMGLLPVSAQESLDPTNKTYSRWTLHGTSHMLGMEVHDCAAARSPKQGSTMGYQDLDLAEGMCLTVEPGLYFQANDLLVPDELRGIGIRIEDDVVITADGALNQSAALPRTPAAIEEWMGRSGGRR